MSLHITERSELRKVSTKLRIDLNLLLRLGVRITHPYGIIILKYTYFPIVPVPDSNCV